LIHKKYIYLLCTYENSGNEKKEIMEVKVEGEETNNNSTKNCYF